MARPHSRLATFIAILIITLFAVAIPGCGSAPSNLISTPTEDSTSASEGAESNEKQESQQENDDDSTDSSDSTNGEETETEETTQRQAPTVELTSSDRAWTAEIVVSDATRDASGWEIRWRKQGETQWSDWTSQAFPTEESESPSHTETGLQNGVTYEIEVRLTFNNGALSAINQASAKPLTTPGAVENLASESANEGLEISFNAPVNDGGATVTGYRYRYRNQERDTWTDWQTTATTSLTLDGLANDMTYDVEVVAVNDAGSGRKHATTGTPDWSFVDVTPPGDSNRDNFGWDLDASGDHLIVTGDPRDQFQKNDDDPFNHVTFLTRSGDGYDEVKTLQRNGIGTVAAISDDTAAVKMFEVNKQVKHSVRIFRYNNQNWTKETDISVEWGPKLTAYGRHSLDLDASRLAVATLDNTKSGKPSGVAEVYERQGDVWVRLGEPVVAPNSDSDGFGTHVAISRSILAVSAPLSDAVHMFRWDGQTWNHTQTINAGNHGTFGSNLDLTQGRLVFGAVASKQVYIYEKNQAGTWEKLATVDAPEGRKKGFGRGVSIDGNLLAVGRRAGETSGYAFLYEKTGGGWELVGELVNDLVSPKAQVGNSVVLENNRLHVAALSHRNAPDTPRGRVFIFDDVSPRYQAP